ncbi:MAG: hypothetical protein V1901_04100 [Patescibacteria group bacterium]
MKKLNKKIHFGCKNCEKKTSVEFSNNVKFCFGVTKKQYFPEDYYRFCIEKNKNRNCNDFMREEVFSMLQGLSTILLEHRLKEINQKNE